MPAVLRGALRAFRKWTAFHCAVLLSIVFCRFFREFSADAPAPRPIEPLAPKRGEKVASFPEKSTCRSRRKLPSPRPPSRSLFRAPTVAGFAFPPLRPRLPIIALSFPPLCAPALGAPPLLPLPSALPAFAPLPSAPPPLRPRLPVSLPAGIFSRAPHPKFFFSVFSFPRTLRRRPKESPCRKKRRAT